MQSNIRSTLEHAYLPMKIENPRNIKYGNINYYRINSVTHVKFSLINFDKHLNIFEDMLVIYLKKSKKLMGKR